MSTTVAVNQSANLRPPRRGKCLVLTVDDTVRSYSLAGLEIGGCTPNAENKQGQNVFIRITTEGDALWFYFSDESNTDLDKTAALAEGGTVAYANSYAGGYMPANSYVDLRINRSQDKYIVVQASATGAKARIYASSDSE
jgi:hypothetical protein